MFTLKVPDSLLFELTGEVLVSDFLDLSDTFINTTEAVAFVAPGVIVPLLADVSLDSGGVGQFRTVTITDLGGDNTVLGGNFGAAAPDHDHGRRG